MRIVCAAALLLVVAAPAIAEDSDSKWEFRHRVEIRGNYRDSDQQRLPLRFQFPGSFLPPGQTTGFLETVDAGRRVELSVAQIRLDLIHGKNFVAHAQLRAIDKHRQNPTSTDRKIDADELWFRFGQKPDFLERPDRTSLFLQMGKAPKMERQPIRLLESYGVASTSFNRFEDLQALVGGSVGRNLYWRLQLSNGNPLFFRDANALAGDNGTPELRQPENPNPVPRLKSGFPILYNAETESLFFENDNLQFGQGLGYRWQNEAQTFGYDVILFHYKRSLADEVNLTGTFYGGDLDLLNGPFDLGGIALRGRNKEEYGGRAYVEWHGLTTIAQFTKQHLAGLQREGYELEAGYTIPLAFGWIQSIQPAARVSGLTNRFRGDATKFPAPSIWWQWTKVDAGVRVGFAHNFDVTIERTRHNVGGPPVKLHMGETLATVRFRI